MSTPKLCIHPMCKLPIDEGGTWTEAQELAIVVVWAANFAAMAGDKGGHKKHEVFIQMGHKAHEAGRHCDIKQVQKKKNNLTEKIRAFSKKMRYVTGNGSEKYICDKFKFPYEIWKLLGDKIVARPSISPQYTIDTSTGQTKSLEGVSESSKKKNTPQIRLTCFAEEEQNEEIGNETGSSQTDEDRADDEPKGPSTEESITQDSPASSSGEQRKTDAKKRGRDFYAGLDEEDEAGKGKRPFLGGSNGAPMRGAAAVARANELLSQSYKDRTEAIRELWGGGSSVASNVGTSGEMGKGLLWIQEKNKEQHEKNEAARLCLENRRLNFEILKYQRENRIPDEEIRHLLEPQSLPVQKSTEEQRPCE